MLPSFMETALAKSAIKFGNLTNSFFHHPGYWVDMLRYVVGIDVILICLYESLSSCTTTEVVLKERMEVCLRRFCVLLAKVFRR